MEKGLNGNEIKKNVHRSNLVNLQLPREKLPPYSTRERERRAFRGSRRSESFSSYFIFPLR
jgi:hypothetical protein